MAEALISMLGELLASPTFQYVKGEVKKVSNVKNDVSKFAEHLEVIQAVLQDAEQRKLTEDRVRIWLDNLKQISFEMVDVLDEWNTNMLRKQVEEQEKVRSSSILGCFCFGKVSRVILHHKIAEKIKDLNERLTDINEQREMYKFQPKVSIQQVPERLKTSCFVDPSNIFGREKDIDILIEKLLGDGDEEGRGLLIIPIVGMGGMGKTTLTQLAYNAEKVKAHFEKRIWVCVSDPFDEIHIAKVISGDITPSSNELNDVLECMSRSIEGKRFLLVLDDVWTENHRKWEQLRVPLIQSGAKGSRILVTTRKLEVVDMMRARDHMINLTGLSEEICLSIFNHWAFLGRDFDEALGAVGQEISKKCKGLPLAAKTLGSCMRDKRAQREWKDVLNSKIWDTKEVEQEVFQPLLLSYYDLAPTVKCCLLYCAIFPKDHVFQRDELIELWMAQDYLNQKRNKDKRIIGDTIFDNLVAKSFFQDFSIDDDSGKIIRCKMHDIVHDFLQFLTRNECVLMDSRCATNEIEVLGDKVRHLTLLHPKDPLSTSISVDNVKNIRTLVAFNSESVVLHPDFLLQLKCLRTLKLSSLSIVELPKDIGELIHLRHIDLSNSSKLEKLPDTICDLYNLCTLRLRYCRALTKLPDNMGKLINLKNLYVLGCDKLVYLPKGIGRLKSLQRVDELRVLCDEHKEEALQIGDVGNLNHLPGDLCIRLEGVVKDVSEVEKSQLWLIEQLFHLRLDLGRVEPTSKATEILNALRPHPNLESLNIYEYMGTTWPNWIISLNNLRILTLAWWVECEVLPALGKLPSLERLTLAIMKRVKKVGGEFLGIEKGQTSFKSSSSSSPLLFFPKLKHLEFISLKEWEEWEGAEAAEIAIMPCLTSLLIEYCPKLNKLPDFLFRTPLQNLHISHCGILEERYKQGSGEEWSNISHIPNIKISRW